MNDRRPLRVGDDGRPGYRSVQVMSSSGVLRSLRCWRRPPSPAPARPPAGATTCTAVGGLVTSLAGLLTAITCLLTLRRTRPRVLTGAAHGRSPAERCPAICVTTAVSATSSSPADPRPARIVWRDRPRQRCFSLPEACCGRRRVGGETVDRADRQPERAGASGCSTGRGAGGSSASEPTGRGGRGAPWAEPPPGAGAPSAGGAGRCRAACTTRPRPGAVAACRIRWLADLKRS
jgi:hypothetical protein